MVVPAEMRARAIALMLLLTNLVGTGLGPPTLGLISDQLASRLGHIEGLRWSLLVMLVVNLGAGFAFWRASRHLKSDADRMVGTGSV
jgi:MFS family permease